MSAVPPLLWIRFPDWIQATVVPGLPIRWYGLMYVVAFLITYALVRKEAQRTRLTNDPEDVSRFFTWIILGALLGGRLLYVFAFGDTAFYLEQPWLIVWPFREGRFTGIQGMSYHGGFAGVVAGAIGFAIARKVRFAAWTDALAVSAPLGYTFGRVGNFINGELPGRVTTMPWGVLFPNVERYPRGEPWVEAVLYETAVPVVAGELMVNLPRHPSQLYEALLEGVLLWLVLWFVVRPRPMFPGSATSIYVLGYGLARFVAEYFRATDETVGYVVSIGAAEPLPQLTTSVLHLTVGQIISLGMFALGVVLFFVFKAIAPEEATIETFEADPSATPQTE